jgi:hypothetical protein
LPAKLAIDAGAVRDSVATGKGPGEFGGVIETEGEELRAAKLAEGGIGLVVTTGDEDGFVAVLGQGAGNVPADEAGAAGDGDFHAAPPFHAAST